MRFRVMGFQAFRASRAAPPSNVTAGDGVPSVPPPLPPLPPVASGERGLGHPTVESQRAGLEHLMRVSLEQAAARRCPAGREGRDAR